MNHRVKLCLKYKHKHKHNTNKNTDCVWVNHGRLYSALVRLGQEDYGELEASLGYTMKLTENN